mmetsp:Transcript_34682/g.83920  ORF Transcript_34682/g.83920 Transcript_34682/m.83920 type:complete len:305 (+) Transcript_34682:91-1005(+)
MGQFPAPIIFKFGTTVVSLTVIVVAVGEILRGSFLWRTLLNLTVAATTFSAGASYLLSLSFLRRHLQSTMVTQTITSVPKEAKTVSIQKSRRNTINSVADLRLNDLDSKRRVSSSGNTPPKKIMIASRVASTINVEDGVSKTCDKPRLRDSVASPRQYIRHVLQIQTPIGDTATGISRRMSTPNLHEVRSRRSSSVAGSRKRASSMQPSRKSEQYKSYQAKKQEGKGKLLRKIEMLLLTGMLLFFMTIFVHIYCSILLYNDPSNRKHYRKSYRDTRMNYKPWEDAKIIIYICTNFYFQLYCANI